MHNSDNLDGMDILNIISFCIGIKNLNENISQNQLQQLVNNAIDDIHNHLNEQDKKLNTIMEVLSCDKN